MTHIRRIRRDFLQRDFFALDPFLSRDFSQQKNTACVNGTMEIILEQIQHDIATSKTLQIRVMCVITLTWKTSFHLVHRKDLPGLWKNDDVSNYILLKL